MLEKWYLRNVKGDLDRISKSLGISKLLSKLLLNRNITSYEIMDSFIDPSLDKLHNPELMKDMDKGIEIIVDSIEKGRNIRISGDYDQDGNSAILTLYKGLKRCGAKVDYVIPHRIIDGYGINDRIVREAKEDGIDLIITCDNGIAAFEPIKLAKDLGMIVIVTDHHDLAYMEDEKGIKQYRLPEADAVINPKRWDCKYPFKELCGAGVAFKLIQALYTKMNIDMEESYELLEFVAMGTVCDVVDLIDENRIIVKEGLKRINNTNNLGLKALIKATGLEEKKINTYSLGFILGPCINASGRLDRADIAVELFLTEDSDKAQRYANRLHELNEERKAMTKKGYEKIVEQIENTDLKEKNVLVIYEPRVHESVAGIIAGRIKDKYYRPTIVLTNSKENGKVKGSGRSIEEYNMFEEISKHKELLLAFGGHPMAAGLSLDVSHIDEFRNRLNTQESLTEDDLTPKVYIDMHIPLDYISFSLIEELEKLEPFGKGNPKPLFGAKNVKVKRGFILGNNQNVLKLLLLTNRGRVIDGIYFGDIEQFEEKMCRKFGKDELNKMYAGVDNKIVLDMIYTPMVNEYMGNRNIQINIQNYR
ncbi:MAG: single-stranded-DNA-specific exonuclease RecJ [Tissierellia bacterium]|nr:single-stranded-DNA-specific exonuclease RecJ [Tissierellia bacterium]